MKIVYVWWGASSAVKGLRPPDELYVEKAAQKLGIDVTRSHYNDAELFDKVGSLKPEIVLFSHPSPKFGGAEVQRIRAASPSSILALLSFDLTSYEGEPNREERYARFLPHLDVFCTKEAGRRKFWAERGVLLRRAIQGHHPWVEKVWKPHSESPDPRGIAFFGSYSPRRDELLARLQEQFGSDIIVCSQTSGWKRTKNITPPVFGLDRSRFLEGVSCAVDISNGPGVTGYHSDRVEDTLASGVPLIAEKPDGPTTDFVSGEHLVYWKIAANLTWWINKVRGDRALSARLSENGSERVRKHFTYRQTVENVIDACGAFLDTKERPAIHYSVVSQPKPKRDNVLILGQWRPQGLGYVSRRIVETVEGAGGRARVASINKNPEWDEEHRFDRDLLPPDDTKSIIFLEKADNKWFQWAKAKGVQTVYFPMWEFFRPSPEMEWAKEADVVTAIPWKAVQNSIGREVLPLEWDSGLIPRKPLFQDLPIFFHDARGVEQRKYNVRPRQHTMEVLAAFGMARARLKSQNKAIRMIMRAKNNPIEGLSEDVLQITGEVTRDYYLDLAAECSAVICPSGPEGLGLPVFEFQSLSVPPIVMSVPPAGMAVTDGVNGLHVESVDGGPKSLARAWAPSIESLAQAIIKLTDMDTVNHLKEGCYETSRLRQGRFDTFLLGILNR